MKWCGQVFSDPVMIVCDLLTDSLLSVQTSLSSCIETYSSISSQSPVLSLIALRQVCSRYCFNNLQCGVQHNDCFPVLYVCIEAQCLHSIVLYYSHQTGVQPLCYIARYRQEDRSRTAVHIAQPLRFIIHIGQRCTFVYSIHVDSTICSCTLWARVHWFAVI